MKRMLTITVLIAAGCAVMPPPSPHRTEPSEGLDQVRSLQDINCPRGDCGPPSPVSFPPSPPRSGPEFRMVALGDSLIWGQGLRHEHKFTELTRVWLQSKLGKTIELRVGAHSGAEVTPSLPPSGEFHPEVPNDYPDIPMLANAIENPELVDLIIVDGGANDIDIKKIFKFGQGLDQFRAHVRSTVMNEAKKLIASLHRFTNAKIVITGLYPFVGPGSDNSMTMLLAAAWVGPLKDDFGVLIRRSNAWVEESNQSYLDAINAQDSADNPLRIARDRIKFASIDKDAWSAHAFGTKDDPWVWPLWELGGKFPDEVSAERVRACNERYSGFSIPGNDKYICRNASMGHPNVRGAQVFAAAIQAKLQEWIDAGVIRPKALPPPPVPLAPPQSALESRIALAPGPGGNLEVLVNGNPPQLGGEPGIGVVPRRLPQVLHGRQTTAGGDWGPFNPIPGLLGAGTPALGQNVDGSLIGFTIHQGKVWLTHRSTVDSAWPAWQSLSGPALADALSVGRTGDGPGGQRVIAVVPGQDGFLYRTFQDRPNGDEWRPLAPLATGVSGRPAIADGPDGSLHIVTRVTKDKSLFHLWQGKDGKWQPISSLGGSFTSSPGLVFRADGTLDVFALGDDRACYHAERSPGGSWSAWAYKGGEFGTTPVATTQADGRMVVFAASGRAIQALTQPADGWAGDTPATWQAVGAAVPGLLTSAPAVARQADGRLVVMATCNETRTATDAIVSGEYLYQARQATVNGGWGTWERIAQLSETVRAR